MKKYLIGAMFVIAIALFTLPSYAADVGYNATVASGQNTYIVSADGNFGTILVGESKVINGSIVLNNTGDVNATVDARFSDNMFGVYGLVSGSNLLSASNFSLMESPFGGWTSLNNSGADIRVATTPASGTTILDARLSVPPSQAGGSYSGTVILTFGNEV